LLASLLLLAVGNVSLIVRRFHDLDLSGYHAIWFAAVEVCWVAITYGSPEAMLFGLPLGVIYFWLALWPGTRGANRFGDVPQ
jgi:uncharacterized membrane protein YhaH (DUF805 family)